MKAGRDNLFTIAIPTYNNEATVARSIESALAQDYNADFEVLVVNNGSTDGTLPTIKEYADDPKLRVISNPKTVNIYENHNICFREAKGRYILFCHSDDYLDPCALESLYRNLLSRGFPRQYICWGHSLYADFYGRIRSAGFTSGQLFCGKRAVEPFLYSGLTPSGTCYCKTFIDIGGFLITEYVASPADASSMVLAALKGFRFEMIQDILVIRREASIATHGRERNQLFREYEDAWTQLFRKLDATATRNLLAQATNANKAPWLFFYAASDLEPRIVAAGALKLLLREPTLFFRSRRVRSCTLRIFRNLVKSRGKRA
jgi:glycosyltransferase involved in cell wall biosynthesis